MPRNILIATLQALGGDYPGLAKTGFDSLEQAFGSKDNDAHDRGLDAQTRAQMLWKEAVVLGIEDLFRSGFHTPLNAEELRGHIVNLLAASEKTNPAARVTAGRVRDPKKHPQYAPLRAAFPDFIRNVAPETPLPRIEAAPDRLDRSIVKGLWRAWQADPDFYTSLESAFTGPAAEAESLQRSWDHHHNWIRHRYYSKPLWFDEERGIALADLYVPPRAFCRWEAKEAEDMSTGQTRAVSAYDERVPKHAEVLDLQSAVNDWLEIDDPRDRIRIVGGGPGSGKSSFARKLAADLANADGWHVLFIEAQNLTAGGDWEDKIGRHLSAADRGGFETNPLSRIGGGYGRVLLIFDGLDEIRAASTNDADLMKTVINQTKELLSSRAGDRANVKALLLGRPTSARDALDELGRGEDRLFDVAKLPPLTYADANVKEHRFSDPWALAEQDQRDAYWQAWMVATGRAPDTPNVLHNEAFGDLTAEPVLVYLLIHSRYAEPDKAPDPSLETVNRNAIYGDIIRRLPPREWGQDKDQNTKGLGEEDFFFLLECLGLASWATGGRIGDENLFKAFKDHCSDRQRKKRYDALPVTALKNVATTFYTRADGGYEFVHKSFSDYLIARGLVRFARERLPSFLENDAESGAEAWLKIAGDAPITPTIIQFMRDEVRRLAETRVEEVRRTCDDLVEVINSAIAHGLPAHETMPLARREVGGKLTLRQTESAERYALGALLAIINAHARALGQSNSENAMITLKWTEGPQSALRMIKRLRLEQDREETCDAITIRDLNDKGNTGLQTCLSHLNLSGMDFLGVFAVDWDLRSCDLAGAFLASANLALANFQEADLRRAHLGASILRKADFRNSNLAEADLDEADLNDANFSNARFSDTIMDDADLASAPLSHSQLKQVFPRQRRLFSEHPQDTDDEDE